MNKQEYEVRRIEDTYDYQDTVEVVYKGEVVFSWNDAAQSDYPEDLTWSRLISDVFDSGIALGKRIALGGIVSK